MSVGNEGSSKQHTEWKEVQLKDLAEVIPGQSPKSDYYNESGKGLPFYQGKAQFGEIYPEVEKWCTKPKKKANPGDILMTVRAPVGALNIADEKCIIGRGLSAIRSKDSNERFIYYLLKANREYIESFAGGAVYDSITKKATQNLEFNVPEIETRAEIANVLSAFDDLIENNKRRIEILEEMAETIYQEWFVNLNFPGSENVGMIDSELGEIPENFEVKEIGEITNSISGGTPKTDNDELWENGDITWYTPSDLTEAGTMFMDDSSRHINKRGLDNSGAKMFPPYSVMMTSRATLGVLAINTTSACTNQGFINVIPEETLGTYYIYHWLQDNMEDIISLAGGATYKELRITVFREIKILVPPENLVDQFKSKLLPIGQGIENLIKRNKKLRQIRDLLLPRLISGEIEV